MKDEVAILSSPSLIIIMCETCGRKATLNPNFVSGCPWNCGSFAVVLAKWQPVQTRESEAQLSLEKEDSASIRPSSKLLTHGCSPLSRTLSSVGEALS